MRAQFDIEMHTYRCGGCRRYYEVEAAYLEITRCPYCVGQTIAQLNERISAERSERHKLERSVKAYQRAAKRRRKRARQQHDAMHAAWLRREEWRARGGGKGT